MAANKNQLFIRISFDTSFHIILVLFYAPSQRLPGSQAHLDVLRSDDAPLPPQSVSRFRETRSFLQEREQQPLRPHLQVHWGMCLLALLLRDPVESKENVQYLVFQNRVVQLRPSAIRAQVQNRCYSSEVDSSRHPESVSAYWEGWLAFSTNHPRTRLSSG